MADDYDSSFEVTGNVPHIRQKGMTCWAAAAAMMYSWAVDRRMEIDEVMKEAGKRIDPPDNSATYADLARKGKGLPFIEIGNLGLALGMKLSALRSFTEMQFFNIMASRNTPIMVCVLFPGDDIAHFLVVYRMQWQGDLAQVVYRDPSHEASSDTAFFNGLYQNMESLAAKKQIYHQILYY